MAKEKEETTVFQDTYDAKVTAMRTLLRPQGREPTYVDCVVPETGETFTAEIQPSNPFPQGRITTLSNLTFPESMIPPGVPKSATDLTRRQWIYENHYQRLLRQFVGKPASILTMYRKDMQEKVRKLEEEAKKLGAA